MAKKDLFFLKEDFIILRDAVKELEDKIIKLGKEQGIAAAQSTENFGHDDACQEVIYDERRVVISRLNEMRPIFNHAKIITPIPPSDKVRFGSIVELSNGRTYQIGSYFILAHHTTKNISYNSPLGQKLISKEVGDEVVHNGTIITIISVK